MAFAIISYFLFRPVAKDSLRPIQTRGLLHCLPWRPLLNTESVVSRVTVVILPARGHSEQDDSPASVSA